MNCEQFENRVQLLLDERVNLALDLTIQKHIRHCADCERTLMLYECISETPVPASERRQVIVSNQVAAAAVDRPQLEWKAQQRRTLRHRMLMAMAALLFVSLILVAQPGSSPSVAELDGVAELDRSEVIGEVLGQPLADSPAFLGSLDWSGMFAETWNSSTNWTGYLRASAYDSLDQMDLFQLIPEEHTRMVRNIPATIETIEPIYRYSTDLPGLKHWSSGLNYTIGLIQNSFNAPQRNEGDDLGQRRRLQKGDFC